MHTDTALTSKASGTDTFISKESAKYKPVNNANNIKLNSTKYKRLSQPSQKFFLRKNKIIGIMYGINEGSSMHVR